MIQNFVLDIFQTVEESDLLSTQQILQNNEACANAYVIKSCFFFFFL